MLQSFKQLDKILRGQATQLPSLQKGQIDIPVKGLSCVLLVLGLAYGICMGSYSMIHGNDGRFMQLFASMVKFPLLFFLTIVVTFPSLYVFNALIGSRLSILSVFRLLLAALGVMLAVVASLGPIVVFFAASTSSYPFMVLLNVTVCGISGLLGLGFLLRTLHRLVIMQEDTEPQMYDSVLWKDSSHSVHQYLQNSKSEENDKIGDSENLDNTIDLEDGQDEEEAFEVEPTEICALDRVGRSTNQKAKSVFKVWLAVFGLVGAQMSWVLRPFIGDPDLPFEWFREQESNFFQAVGQALLALFGG